MNSIRRPGSIWPLVVTLATAGCAGHVRLDAPGPSAPPQQRMAAYEELRPTEYRVTHTVSGASSYSDVDFVELNNGTRVRLPEDLLPLVPPTSSAAESMRESRNQRHQSQWFGLGGYAAVITGAVVLLGGASADQKPVAYGGLGLVIAGAICLPIGNGHANRSTAAAQRAYEQYDSALRRRLGLCEDGERVVPCR